ncbi:Cof-type HAD-IIB family hydrolase [Malacoplasma muris]|uniref:Cof-type HAD-IIB family hydrolase n=1 Tax=Malacoplasma muris TaxID=2119 RepID=UPI00398F5EF6
MNYKVAMIDLDGTLLHNRTSISQTNLEALKKYKDNGGDIVIATGRWPLSSFVFNKTIEEFVGSPNKYLVTLNGALIYQLSDNTLIYEQAIDDEIFEKILELRKKFNLAMWIYSKEGIDNKLIHSYKIPFKWFISKFNYGKIINHRGEKLKTYKILFGSFNRKKIDDVYSWLDKYFCDYLNIIRTSKKVIEVTHKNVDKGFALEFISKKENIKKQNIVCFGDSGNDVSMFINSGFKVCLNRNNQDLSKISNVVANHKNGVAFAIDKYLFNITDFSNDKVLNLNFYGTLFNVVEHVDFVKNLKFWEYLISGQPLSILSKYSLNDNLMMFKSIIDINKNILINCGDGSVVYSCKTKKIIKKSIITETQLSLLTNFLTKSLNNEMVSIIINQTSGSNYFLTSNPNNFINFIRDTGFNEENFTVIDRDFEKYLSPHTSKYTNIIIIGIDSIPNSININSFRIDIRGNVISIANKVNFIDNYEEIVKEHFNCSAIETIDVKTIINSEKQLFSSIDDLIKNNF